MGYLKKINKKLGKAFEGKVEASEESGLLILSGELQSWRDVVRAGEMSVNRDRYAGLVNDIRCTGERPSPTRMPSVRDSALNGETPDVLVIGGGVIGCAIARELTRYKLAVLLVEKEHDLAMQTSGRNNGMVHTGADLKKGTKKYHYNRLGNRMYGDVCEELGVKFDRCGQYICVDKLYQKPLVHLSVIYWRWKGLKGVKALGKTKLRKAEPTISHDVCAALFFPDTGIVCPYSLTVAYAENAVLNGASVSLDTIVRDMEVEDGAIKSVSTNRGKVYPTVVVNAAGVFCEDIAAMAGDRFYSIHPRKGTSAIIDKKYTGSIVQTAVSPLRDPSSKKAHSKGGGVMRTADGNALVGPDAVETIEKEDFSTARQSVAGTILRQGRTLPALEESQIITYFSGIRASTYEEDFVVCKGRYTKNLVHAAGIQSPGLTAAPAIGADVARMVVELFGGERAVEPNPRFDPRREPAPRLAELDDSERADMIEGNPDYGVIVCRCEEISKGEILDALRGSIPCSTIDGVKRRVRPGMGRCQGGFCGPLVLDIIAREKGVAPHEVRKSGYGSEILLRPTKEARRNGV